MGAAIEFEKTRGFRLAALAAGAFLAVVAGLVGLYHASHQATLTHVTIVGGGFFAYYRLGEIRAGITVAVQKPTEPQSRLVARFENPAGGDPVVVETRIRHGLARYGLETPALSGVVKDRPYQVTLELYGYGGEAPIETHLRTIASDVDPARLPDRPLTIGPGYHKAPAPDGERRVPAD